MILSPHACVGCGRFPKKNEKFDWKKYHYVFKKKNHQSHEFFTAFVCPECRILAKAKQKHNALIFLTVEVILFLMSFLSVENNVISQLNDPSARNFAISAIIFLLIAIPLQTYSDHPSKVYFHTVNHWGKLRFSFKCGVFTQKFKEKLIETSNLDMLESY